MKVALISVSHDPSESDAKSVDTAIGRYLKHTIDGMRPLLGSEVDVTLVTNEESKVSDADDFEIARAFKKNHFIGFRLFWYFIRNRYDVIHLQHEFFIYGGPLRSVLLSLGLLFIPGTKRITTAHHIVDIDEVDIAMVKANNYKYPVWFIRLALRITYGMLFLASHRIIAHEHSHKQVLVKNWERYFKDIDSRIDVVPHGIGRRESLELGHARQRLGGNAEKYVLFFGYVSRHKGLELLLDAVESLQAEGENISVIVAGGEHPKLSTDSDYRSYYSELKKRARDLRHVVWHGFAAEDELPLIFSAADLGVFPYKTRQAASGAVTDCIAFGLPFIVSERFKNNKQFNGLTFDLNADDLAKKIKEMLTQRARVKAEIERWQDEYSWEKSAKSQLALYNGMLSQ